MKTNPSTGCGNYSVPAPIIGGAIAPVSPVNLSTESVYLCGFDWEKHLKNDGHLKIKKCRKKESDYEDISFVEEAGEFKVGGEYTMTEETGYDLNKKGFALQIENPGYLNGFQDMVERGYTVTFSVTTILKDPMLGHAVVLKITNAQSRHRPFAFLRFH